MKPPNFLVVFYGKKNFFLAKFKIALRLQEVVIGNTETCGVADTLIYRAKH